MWKCTKCGEEITDDRIRCWNCSTTKDEKSVKINQTERKIGNAKYYCNTCHNSPPVAIMKGNGWVEFILYLCYIAPGIIYSVWRRSGEPNVCPVCKTAALVPLSEAKPLTTLPAEDVREERECPHCAEKILIKAKICKHCGKSVQA